MSLLELTHVSKFRVDGRERIAALDDVSMRVEEGDRVGIWGVRRSGKTKLLRVAAGIEQADEGRISFLGRDLGALSQDERARLMRRGGIGLVSAPWRQDRNHSVIGHVALALLNDDINVRGARAEAMRALARVGLGGCAHSSTDELSQNELVRLRLAQQLVRRPRLLLVDEPAVLSSPGASAELFKLLWSLTVDPKMALVVASEELDPIQAASRRMTMEHGRLRSMDKPAVVLQFPDKLAAG